MITRELIHALSNDLHAERAPGPRYLCALVEMATLSEKTRTRLTAYPGNELLPLLVDPTLETIKPLGAHLIAPREDLGKTYRTLIDSLASYDDETIVAWIVSTLKPADLVDHLSQATFVDDEHGERYLLRYYDRRVTPLLLMHAPKPWSRWLFSPMVSWWISGATPSHTTWSKIACPGLAKPHPEVPRLVMTSELLQALNYDTRPQQLLDIFNQQLPSLFTISCQGVRRAQIESLLKKGSKCGLVDHHDLVEFIGRHLRDSPEKLEKDPRWHAAVQRTAEGQGRLSELYSRGNTRA
ncbi:DUF4123 domain-containing protein [Pseudomonas sp. 2835]|uniref:DUF4123 domain-containing protein n=1 Tax=Pseudomonas sp. 2835 TaxID=3156451 RepID=UPI003D201871